jgi:hypothetical protein
MESKRRRVSLPLLLAVVAIIVAVAGSTVGVSVAKKKKKKAPVVPPHFASMTRVVQPVTLPAQGTNNGIFEFQLDCPAGTSVTGGGLTIAQTEQLDPVLSESAPEGNGWHVAGDIDITTPQPATVTALCLRP